MEKTNVLNALKHIKEQSKKRTFVQTVDLIINLQGLDLKKPEEQVDFFTQLPHTTGKKIKTCAFVGPELKDESEKNCDKVILIEEVANYDKKKAKKLSMEYDYFIAQANIMAKVAAALGKVLGPRGKMPNPKAGCVVPPKTTLKPLCDKLQKTIRLQAKDKLVLYCSVGKEDQPENEVVENILSAYNQLVNVLPNHEHNVHDVLVKYTMSKPVKISHG